MAARLLGQADQSRLAADAAHAPQLCSPERGTKGQAQGLQRLITMPELPELEVVREVLQRRAVGQTIAKVEIRPPGGLIVVRDLTHAGFEATLTGVTIGAVRSAGQVPGLLVANPIQTAIPGGQSQAHRALATGSRRRQAHAAHARRVHFRRRPATALRRPKANGPALSHP